MSSINSNSTQTVIDILSGNQLKIVDSSGNVIATDSNLPTATTSNYQTVIADTYELGDPVYIGLDGAAVRPVSSFGTYGLLEIPVIQNSASGTWPDMENSGHVFCRNKDTEYGLMVFKDSGTTTSVQKVRIYGKVFIPIGPSVRLPITTGAYLRTDYSTNTHIIYHEEQDRYILMLVSSTGWATLAVVNPNGAASEDAPNLEAEVRLYDLITVGIAYTPSMAYVKGNNPSIAFACGGGYYTCRMTYTPSGGLVAGTVEHVYPSNTSYGCDIEYNEYLDVLMLVTVNPNDTYKCAIHFADAAGDATDQYGFGALIPVGTTTYSTYSWGKAINSDVLTGEADFLVYDFAANGQFWKIGYVSESSANVATTFSSNALNKRNMEWNPYNNLLYTCTSSGSTIIFNAKNLQTNTNEQFISGTFSGVAVYGLTVINGIARTYGTDNNRGLHSITWAEPAYYSKIGDYPIVSDPGRFLGIVASMEGGIGGTATITTPGNIHLGPDKLTAYATNRAGSQLSAVRNSTTGAFSYSASSSSLYAPVGRSVHNLDDSGVSGATIINPTRYT